MIICNGGVKVLSRFNTKGLFYDWQFYRVSCCGFVGDIHICKVWFAISWNTPLQKAGLRDPFSSYHPISC
jgi:hypothetical protein